MKHLLRWSVALCLLMAVVVAAPNLTPSASAAGNYCVEDHTGWTPLSSSEDIKALGTEGTGTTADTYVLPAGNYYLTGDIKTDYGIQFSGKTKLCLNGHVLSVDAQDLTNTSLTAFLRVVGATSVLDIYDHEGAGGAFRITFQEGTTPSATAGRYVLRNDGGTVNFYSGALSDSYGRYGLIYNNNETGVFNMYEGAAIKDSNGLSVIGAVGLWDSSTFNMYGGEISNIKGGGGVIHNQSGNGHINIYDGRITGNSLPGINNAGTDKTATITMSGGEISNNTSASNGAGVNLNGGTFTMTGGVISGNKCTATTQADSRGGAVYIQGSGVFNLEGGTLSNNQAISGGAIGMLAGTFNMTSGEISGNTAGLCDGAGAITGGGGGIGGGALAQWSGSTKANITGGAIKNNRTFAQGGAVSIYTGTTSVSNAEVSGNAVTAATSDTYGGAFFLGSASSGAKLSPVVLNIGDGAMITGNGHASATSSKKLYGTVIYASRGGSVVMDGGTITGNDCTFGYSVINLNTNASGVSGTMVMNGGEITENTTERGALFIEGGKTVSGTLTGGAEFTLNNGTISKNTATGSIGGAVFMFADGAKMNIHGGVISENATVRTGDGAGGIAVRGGKLVMTDGKIIDNSCAGNGAGVMVYNAASEFHMEGGLISGNKITGTTAYDGGGVNVNTNAKFVMSGGAITGNSSTRNGGGVYVVGATMQFSDGEISDNTAPTNGKDILALGSSTTTVFEMSSGTIGTAKDTGSTLNFYSSGTTKVEANISGGTVNSGIGSSGSGDTKVVITNGSFNAVYSAYGVTVNGGLFAKQGAITSENIVLANGEQGALVDYPDAVYKYAVGVDFAKSANMLLSNDLTFNVYVPVRNTAWFVNNAERVPTSVTVTVGDRAAFSTGILQLLADGDYYKIPVPVYAKEMAETITLTFSDADGAFRTVSDSVKDYAARVLALDVATAEEKTLMVDMLNYGAAAQVYFDYKADVPANADLTEDQLAMATAVELVETTANTVHSRAYHSANLTLENQIDLSMFFWKDAVAADANYEYSVNSSDGTLLGSGGGVFHDVLDEDEYLYYITIPLKIGEVKDAVITVTYTDKNGDQLVAKDSVENYLYRNNGLALNDAPAVWGADGKLISDATAMTDVSKLYDKVMAFATSAVAYAQSTIMG